MMTDWFAGPKLHATDWTMRKIWIRRCGVACVNSKDRLFAVPRMGACSRDLARKHASKSSQLGKSTTEYDRMDAPHIVSCHFGVTHFANNPQLLFHRLDNSFCFIGDGPTDSIENLTFETDGNVKVPIGIGKAATADCQPSFHGRFIGEETTRARGLLLYVNAETSADA